MRPRVSVVVVTYQSREYILPCLESLSRDQGKLEIVVVDNASTDGTVEIVKERFPAVTIIQSPRNLGFAAGANLGIRHAPPTPYVLLLNPDSIVSRYAIPTLVESAEADEQLGILGPQVFDDLQRTERYPSCRRFPELTTAVFNPNSLWTKLFGSNRFSGSYLYYDYDLSRSTSVDWVSGCAMLIRTKVLDDIGLFDEGFFFYYEDIDFCWRAKKAGWEVMYCPEASVVHFRSKSSEKVPFLTLLAKHRSMVRIYKKHVRKSFLLDPLVFIGGWIRVTLLVGREALRRKSMKARVQPQGAQDVGHDTNWNASPNDSRLCPEPKDELGEDRTERRKGIVTQEGV